MRPSIYVCMTACHMFQCQAVVWCNDGLSILIGNFQKQTVKFLSKYGGFHSSKCIWKYSPQNCVHFVSASMHLITWWLTAHIFRYHWNLILIIMSRVTDCRGADLRRHWLHRGLSLWWHAMSPVTARLWHSGGCCLSDLIEADPLCVFTYDQFSWISDAKDVYTWMPVVRYIYVLLHLHFTFVF